MIGSSEPIRRAFAGEAHDDNGLDLNFSNRRLVQALIDFYQSLYDGFATLLINHLHNDTTDATSEWDMAGIQQDQPRFMESLREAQRAAQSDIEILTAILGNQTQGALTGGDRHRRALTVEEEGYDVMGEVTVLRLRLHKYTQIHKAESPTFTLSTNFPQCWQNLYKCKTTFGGELHLKKRHGSWQKRCIEKKRSNKNELRTKRHSDWQEVFREKSSTAQLHDSTPVTVAAKYLQGDHITHCGPRNSPTTITTSTVGDLTNYTRSSSLVTEIASCRRKYLQQSCWV